MCIPARRTPFRRKADVLLRRRYRAPSLKGGKPPNWRDMMPLRGVRASPERRPQFLLTAPVETATQSLMGNGYKEVATPGSALVLTHQGTDNRVGASFVVLTRRMVARIEEADNRENALFRKIVRAVETRGRGCLVIAMPRRHFLPWRLSLLS
jgi:hypothetical protein